MAKKKQKWDDMHPEVGDNAQFLQRKFELYKWGAVKMSDEVAVAERCEKYVQWCIDNDYKATSSEFAVSLGIGRPALFEYMNGRLGKNPKVVLVLRRTHEMISSLLEDYMVGGKINPVSGIFMLKNSGLGYKDNQEVSINHNIGQSSTADITMLQQRYLPGVVIESPPEETPAASDELKAEEPK